MDYKYLKLNNQYGRTKMDEKDTIEIKKLL